MCTHEKKKKTSYLLCIPAKRLKATLKEDGTLLGSREQYGGEKCRQTEEEQDGYLTRRSQYIIQFPLPHPWKSFINSSLGNVSINWDRPIDQEICFIKIFHCIVKPVYIHIYIILYRKIPQDLNIFCFCDWLRTCLIPVPSIWNNVVFIMLSFASFSRLIDRLVLKTCQPAKGYFKHRN